MTDNSQNRFSPLFCFVMCGGALLYASTASGQARDLVEPNVMLLIDSSGSMDWRDDTGRAEATPPVDRWGWAEKACVDNLNTPAGKTSWQKLQDTFLGTIPEENYRCAVERPGQRPNLETISDAEKSDYVPKHIGEYREVSRSHYRAVNCLPDMWQADYNQCIDISGAYGLSDVVNRMTVTRCKSTQVYTPTDDPNHLDYCMNMQPEARDRLGNGILDSYGAKVRFGAMTYDNLPKCWGDGCKTDRYETRWDYGAYRHWDCGGIDSSGGSIGNICYDWNAGARGGGSQWWDTPSQTYKGALGGLVGIGLDANSSNPDVAKLLRGVEPLNCSPLAAMVDDVGFYFAKDKNVLPPAMEGHDPYYRCRPKIALLITDGQPTPDFEFPAGSCTNDHDSAVPLDKQISPADWDPMDDARNTHEDNGPPFANDTKIFDCPWRSAPEEAGELFDVGARILADKLGIDAKGCEPPGCWPVLLVVVGFNVPEVDCAATPKKCYRYTPDYEPCWKHLEPCVADADAGPDEETECMMTPREFLNEIACQGWPWNPSSENSILYSDGSITHSTEFQPPWLKADANFCSDAGGNVVCTKYPDGETDRALFVQEPGELASVLDMLMVELSSNVATRTDAVVWNVPPSSSGSSPAQYEFRSGYVAKSGRPWQGILTRKDWSCDKKDEDVTGSGGNLYNVAEQIKGQTSRNILSYTGSLTYSPREPSFTNISSWVAPHALSGGLKPISDDSFTDCDFGVASVYGSSACENYKIAKNYILDQIIDAGLADIYNSTPALLGPPYDRLRSASYQLYRADGNLSRPPFLFVGTNDGILHGVDVDEISADNPNPEKWGFIPQSFLQELAKIYTVSNRIHERYDADGNIIAYELDNDAINGGSPGLYKHEFLMDGSPVARDVLLIRRADQHFDAAVENEETWRALVFGTGGRSTQTLYALDVTENLKDDTKDPELRFEINPGLGMYGNNPDNSPAESPERAALDKLGMPLSRPALAYIREDVNDGGTNTKTVMAAAIVPGGWRDEAQDANDENVLTWAGNTGVYILRLSDGKLIRYLDPQTDICDGGAGLIYDANNDVYLDGAQLIGEPVVPHGTRNLNVTDHAFIGDDRGRIWLIDLNDESSDEWCLSLYFDTLLAWDYPYADCEDTATTPCTVDPTADCVWTDCCRGNEIQLPCNTANFKSRNMRGPRSMLIGAPSIAQDKNNKDVLVFGTGQYDELTKWNRNRIFSVTDNVEVVGTQVTHTPTVNWWVGDPTLGDADIFADAAADSRLQSMLLEFQNQMKSSASPPTYVNLAAGKYPVTDSNDTTAASVGPVKVPQAFWNVGEKLIGRPVIFDDVAYFTTYVPLADRHDIEDACDEGASRVWALDYDTYNADAEIDSQAFIGKFKTGDNYVPFYNYYHELFSGVQVVKRPQCSASDPIVFKLLVQKANPPPNGAAMSGTPPSDAVQTKSINISKGGSTSLVAVRFDSWSIVF